MSVKDGGPAYPARRLDEDPLQEGAMAITAWSGMSLRDFFAAQALASLPMDIKQYDDMADGIQGAARRSRAAYIIADAMLAERAKS